MLRTQMNLFGHPRLLSVSSLSLPPSAPIYMHARHTTSLRLVIHLDPSPFPTFRRRTRAAVHVFSDAGQQHTLHHFLAGPQMSMSLPSYLRRVCCRTESRWGSRTAALVAPACRFSEPPAWRDCVRTASAQRAAGQRTWTAPAIPSHSHTRAPTAVPHAMHLPSTAPSHRPRLLVSACLLGHRVAYHGHSPSAGQRSSRKHHGRRAADIGTEQTESCVSGPHAALAPMPFLQYVLSDFYGLVDLVPLCPEVQLLGLSVPRRPIHLVKTAIDGVIDVRESGHAAKTLVSLSPGATLRSCVPAHSCANSVPKTSNQTSLTCVDGADVEALLKSIDGVILKSRSPSCGVGDARLYTSRGATARSSEWEQTDGFFTQLMRRSLGPEQPAVVVTTERQLLVLDDANQEEVAFVVARSSQGRSSHEHGDALDKFRASPENTLMRFVEHALTHCAARAARTVSSG